MGLPIYLGFGVIFGYRALQSPYCAGVVGRVKAFAPGTIKLIFQSVGTGVGLNIISKIYQASETLANINYSNTLTKTYKEIRKGEIPTIDKSIIDNLTVAFGKSNDNWEYAEALLSNYTIIPLFEIEYSTVLKNGLVTSLNYTLVPLARGTGEAAGIVLGTFIRGARGAVMPVFKEVTTELIVTGKEAGGHLGSELLHAGLDVAGDALNAVSTSAQKSLSTQIYQPAPANTRSLDEMFSDISSSVATSVAAILPQEPVLPIVEFFSSATEAAPAFVAPGEISSSVPAPEATTYSVVEKLQDPRMLVSAAAVTLLAAGSFAYYNYKQSKNKVAALAEKCSDVAHKVLTPAEVQGSPSQENRVNLNFFANGNSSAHP